jgi:hypothetical protein
METKLLIQALQPGVDCPTVEVLGRYADNALVRCEEATITAHIDACTVCRSELTLLRTFSRGIVRHDELRMAREIVALLQRRETPIAAAPTARKTWMPRFGLFRPLHLTMSLAVVLLAVSGSYFIFTTSPPELPSTLALGVGVTRSLAVQLDRPRGELTAAPQRLEWRRVPGAARYRARLMEVDRLELWSIETAATTADLPAAIRARVVPGKTLVWQVTAYDAADAPIAESHLEPFRLARR